MGAVAKYAFRYHRRIIVVDRSAEMISCRVVKGLCVFVVVAALTTMAPTTSEAGTDYGQFCWTLGGLDDVIRCAITVANGPELMAELHCSDTSVLGDYQLLGAGLARFSFTTPNALQLSFVTASDNSTTFFLWGE